MGGMLYRKISKNWIVGNFKKIRENPFRYGKVYLLAS